MQRANAVLPDRKGHCPERPERRDPHDDPDDAEERFRNVLQPVNDCTAAVSCDDEPESDQNRQNEYLQRLPGGKRASHTVRDELEESLDGRWIGGPCHRSANSDPVGGSRIECDPMTRLVEIGYDEAKDKRHCRHDLEVDQRLDPNACDVLQVTHPRNADRDGGKDHGSDHQPNEPYEEVPERLCVLREIGVGSPERYTRRNGNEDLNIQPTIRRHASA